MSNSLDPDQARRFVGPDLGPNCLPRLSDDGTGRQRVNGKTMLFEFKVIYSKCLECSRYGRYCHCGNGTIVVKAHQLG